VPVAAWSEPTDRRARRRAVALGLAVAAGYAAVYVITLVASDRHQRPLFDGFAPSAPYRWVDPPPELETGNQKPEPSSTELPLGDQGLPVGQANSDDGQLVLNLPEGSVPPRPGESTVRIVIVPLAPDTLGPLPPSRYAAGNAYQVEMTYQPSGEKIESLTTPGNILLTLPWAGSELLQSADGQSWQPVGGSVHTGTSLGGPTSQLGYFLGTTNLPVGSAGAGDSGGVSVWLIVLLVAALAGGLVLVPVLVRRSRRGHEEQKALERRRRSSPAPSRKKTQNKKKKKR
ncbi:MAG: hypothetical protein M3179_01140, partial [Actinomycetota bacterium]|nr:hypothetical protein [Actinomycetota bacterium]